MTLTLCSLSLIGLLQGIGYICGMMTIMRMMVVTGMMMMMMMINFLSGMTSIKTERLKRPQ